MWFWLLRCIMLLGTGGTQDCSFGEYIFYFSSLNYFLSICTNFNIGVTMIPCNIHVALLYTKYFT